VGQLEHSVRAEMKQVIEEQLGDANEEEGEEENAH
jgi:hypothetical protein